jgi:hypothetical protein
VGGGGTVWHTYISKTFIFLMSRQHFVVNLAKQMLKQAHKEWESASKADRAITAFNLRLIIISRKYICSDVSFFCNKFSLLCSQLSVYRNP